MKRIALFLVLFCVFGGIANASVPMITAGYCHVAGLKSDGTVIAVDADNRYVYGQCNVSSWSDIKQIAAGNFHTVGLKNDGTVVAVGWNGYDQCNVSSWSDIKQISTGPHITVGLKNDGTVVATGDNRRDQCNVSSWYDIKQVSAGMYHTVGLKNDGTVVVVGDNYYGQFDASSLSDIEQIAAGIYHTAGLKNDGTVVAAGYNGYGSCNVSSWSDIKQISAGYFLTMGLKNDGTVVATGKNYYGECNVSSWSDIHQVAESKGFDALGLKNDGTVVAVGRNNFSQYVSDWDLIDEVEEVNLSLGATAEQSSSYYADAEKAIDGNTSGEWSDGSTTHTLKNNKAWWRADLGSSAYISSIEIYNRTDCCSNRLSNFQVSVSDEYGNITWTEVYPGQANTYDPTVFNVNAYGQYVLIQLLGTNYLSLAEVEIYGFR